MNAFTSFPAPEFPRPLVAAIGAYEVFSLAAVQADDDDLRSDMVSAAGTALDRAVTIPTGNPRGIQAKLAAVLDYVEGEAVEADYLKMIARDLHSLPEVTLGQFQLRKARTSRHARVSLSWLLANHAVFNRVANTNDDDEVVTGACLQALKILDEALRLPAFDLLEVRQKIDAMLLEADGEHIENDHAKLIARDLGLLLGSTPPDTILQAA